MSYLEDAHPEPNPVAKLDQSHSHECETYKWIYRLEQEVNLRTILEKKNKELEQQNKELEQQNRNLKTQLQPIKRYYASLQALLGTSATLGIITLMGFLLVKLFRWAVM